MRREQPSEKLGLNKFPGSIGIREVPLRVLVETILEKTILVKAVHRRIMAGRLRSKC